MINEALKVFFIRNPEVVKSIEKYSFQNKLLDSKKKSLFKSIWTRFLKTNRKLTKKQRAALEAVDCEEPTLTYAEAAKVEGISRDSLQDQVPAKHWVLFGSLSPFYLSKIRTAANLQMISYGAENSYYPFVSVPDGLRRSKL